MSAHATLDPARVPSGGNTTLIIRVRINPPWYIYAADCPTSIAIPTSLTVGFPTGVEPAAEWEYPAARRIQKERGECDVYEGAVVFRRPIRITSEAPSGSVDVPCELEFQACDNLRCSPPVCVPLTAALEIVAR